MAIKYPQTVDTDAKKANYIYRVQELLRLEHNKNGKEMALEDFRVYQNGEFAIKSDLIASEILRLRELAKKDTTYDADINLNSLEV